MSKSSYTTPSLPTMREVLAILKEKGGSMERKELIRRFNLKGAQRRDFRDMLREMAENGQLAYAGAIVRLHAELPRSIVVEVTATDSDGLLIAEAVDPKHRERNAQIIMEDGTDLTVGERALVELREIQPNNFLARVMQKMAGKGTFTVLGTFYGTAPGHPGHLTPLNPNMVPRLFLVTADDIAKHKLSDGSVLLAKPLPQDNPHMPPTVEVLDVLGEDSKGLESLIAIHNHNIPHVFPQEVLDEAEGLPDTLDKSEVREREDLRKLPIVTIDGADAKDFDDAVWAEEWENGGYHIVVAIADVAHYIREGSELDKEAFTRGNSVYFPDRVVPMLPERISNNLCSLRPREDRPTLAVHMYIDKDGEMKDFRFVRAVIHSAARLTYEQVQDAIDGNPDHMCSGVWDSTLKPLHAAFKILLKARDGRGALDLDVPEKKVIVGPHGEIHEIIRRQRKHAHMLIEEMMILANVAAAKALESKGAPCLYRVHPSPSPERLENLSIQLKPHGIAVPTKGNITPEQIQKVILLAKKQEDSEGMFQMILRSQQQARYDPANVGHFGLALHSYAHFTSPIRRYSDLIVHRSLIKNLGLAGKGALKTPASRFGAIAEHISLTERKAQLAEWEAVDRLTARFYGKDIGSFFEARVSSVMKFGLFVSIDKGVAEGLIPMSYMGADRFDYDPRTQTLTGRRTHTRYKTGDHITVTLIEASPEIGKLTFALGEIEDLSALDKPSRFQGRPDRARRRDMDNKKGGRRPFRKRDDSSGSGERTDRDGQRRKDFRSTDGSSKPAQGGGGRPFRKRDDSTGGGERKDRDGQYRKDFRSADGSSRPSQGGGGRPFRKRDDSTGGGERKDRDGQYRKDFRGADGSAKPAQGSGKPFRKRDDSAGGGSDKPFARKGKDGGKPFRKDKSTDRKNRRDKPRGGA
ncbi:MAG: ribonuclease R [Proteobacteria bacterium]|nr:ribonuclease R [Pseudomonadota bacterium]